MWRALGFTSLLNGVNFGLGLCLYLGLGLLIGLGLLFRCNWVKSRLGLVLVYLGFGPRVKIGLVQCQYIY